MMGHKICFYGIIWKIIPELSLLPFLSRALGISNNLNLKSVNQTALHSSRFLVGNQVTEYIYFSCISQAVLDKPIFTKHSTKSMMFW